MGLGVLDDYSLTRVPGTSTLEELQGLLSPERRDNVPLKHSKGPKPVILIPQPSDDPNDPLNWPIWRRDLIVLVLSLMSVIASTLSPLLAAFSLNLVFYFDITFTSVALLTGYHLLGVAIAGFVFIPTARVWGKRQLYILGTIIIAISSLWGGLSKHNYKSLVAARFFQGVGLAPFEALVNASVGDLYFVHERGKRMALTNLALFGGAFFTPVLVGRIAETLGWQWTFYFCAIFSLAMLPLIVLLVPETSFVRPEVALDQSSDPDHLPAPEMELHGHKSEHTVTTQRALTTEPRPKDTYIQSLRLFNGRRTDASFLQLLLRPLPLFLHPGVLFSCLIQGTMIGWTVLFGIVLAAVMLQAPLFFGQVQTGDMYTGAFIGALLGFLLAGLISDPTIRLLTRWNKGIYEPEFRLVLVFPMLLFGCAGIYGFGITVNNTFRYRWFAPDLFFALQVSGTILGAVTSALYIVDAHKDLSVEAFTCLLIFKNIFSFGLTFRGYDWLVSGGIKPVFIAIGSAQVFICCLAVPMYVLGKKNRAFFARNDMLKLLHLR